MARKQSRPKRDTITEIGWVCLCLAFVAFVVVLILLYAFNT
jgi:hypothetical protein